MNKPHKHRDLIVAWANDPSITLQVLNNEGLWKDVQGTPTWYENTEYRIKPKTWEPRYGDFWVLSNGRICDNKPSAGVQEFGTMRLNPGAAERAAKEMRAFNRLLAYRDEFAPGYEPAPGKYSCTVYWSFEEAKYVRVEHLGPAAVCGVYFPRNVADELVRKLNEGEVEL